MCRNTAQLTPHIHLEQVTQCYTANGIIPLQIMNQNFMAPIIRAHFLLALAGNRSTSSSVLMSSSWSRSTPRYVNLRKVRGFFAASSAILASFWCYSILACLSFAVALLATLEGGSRNGQGIIALWLPLRCPQLLQTVRVCPLAGSSLEH